MVGFVRLLLTALLGLKAAGGEQLLQMTPGLDLHLMIAVLQLLDTRILQCAVR